MFGSEVPGWQVPVESQHPEQVAEQGAPVSAVPLLLPLLLLLAPPSSPELLLVASSPDPDDEVDDPDVDPELPYPLLEAPELAPLDP